jgi:uncharacterized protein YlaN (UPF0358 family)
MINNSFKKPSFLALTSELHRTVKPNSDAVVTTKLFEVTNKIFFAVRGEIVEKIFSQLLLELHKFLSYVSKRTEIPYVKF